MSKLSPDALTEHLFRDLGWRIDQCHGKRGMFSHDLFEFADQFAFSKQCGQYAMIQSTGHSGGNMAFRRRKIVESDDARAWLWMAPTANRIFLIGWKDRGKVRPVATCEEFHLIDGEMTVSKIGSSLCVPFMLHTTTS